MISPTKDYYRFINETWLKNTVIPSDAASTNISRMIAEKIERQLISIIRNKLSHEPDSKLTKFVKSIYHTWESPKQTEYAVVEILGALKYMHTKEEVGYMIGKLNRIQMRSPLIVKVTSDAYDNSFYRLQFSEYVSCLPHNHILLEEGYSKERQAYREFVKKVGTYFGQDDLDKYVDLEIQIAKHLPTPIEEDDTPGRYHKVSLNSLMTDYANIPWNGILEGVGTTIEKQQKNDVLITNPKYLHFLNTFFKTESIEDMRLWLYGSAILTMGRFISGEVYNHYFHFYGTVLKGALTPSNTDRMMMTILTTHLPQLVSREYTEKYVSKQVKKEVIDLTHVIKKAAIRRIRSAEWMSLETQVKAVAKVNKMGFKISHPTVWRDESRGEDFSATLLMKNLFSINEKDTQYGLEDIGRRDKIKSDYWDSSTFEVNAFYYPDYNEMIIPAGILQPPFYDSNKSIAWNLGGIGNVITHELTHGFDSEGRNHDSDGNYDPWWTDEENKEYEKKSAIIEKLFTVPYMGSMIDGKLTLMENIADLGGVGISLDALREEMKGKSASEKKRMLHDYFSAYAVSWRNKDRTRKAELASKSDKHAPPELRVNKIISQFPEFYEAYSVEEGDRLWVDPEKRVTIW